MRHSMAFGLTCVVLLSGRSTAGEDRLWLIRAGQARASIVAGSEDDYSAERLQRGLCEAAGVKRPIRGKGDRLPDAQPRQAVILLGSGKSNRALAEAAARAGLDISPASLTDQGYAARWIHQEGKDVLLLAGGGRDGALHAVVDLLNWRLERSAGDAWIGPLNSREVPRMRYRWLWTWDNRMDWGGPGKPVTVMGGGTSHKRPEAFLIDYKRCVDYMADHKFNGLIIWGLLRDVHGGVQAAQELCRYAARRGVRILPGVGTSGYAGYYYEGKNIFNADQWLREHPELRAINEQGKPHAAPCPSKKANQDWLDRGAEWLFKTFEVGGVNLEMGDFFVCYCDDCKRARGAIASREPDYYKDMAISHMVTLKTMRRLAPEAWLSYATYTGYTAAMMQQRPLFLSLISEDSLCQWTLTGMAPRWEAGLRPMAKHNIGYLHWCNSSTNTADDFYLDEVRAICANAAGVGFEGLDTYGELSDRQPNAELFYLAWEAFLWQPDMTRQQFVDTRLARLYGGAAAAGKVLEIIPLVRTANDRKKGDNCVRAVELAERARGEAAPAGKEHWDRLVAMLQRLRGEVDQARQAQRAQEQAARQGRKIEIAAVRASDEDRRRGWGAQRAIDGNVEEPRGYWLTQRTHPKAAWLELALAQPSKVDRIVLFHQLEAAHYRTLDYRVSVREHGQWKPVVEVRDNPASGWVGHPIAPVTTDAVRLEITRSKYGDRMGVGEIELRRSE